MTVEEYKARYPHMDAKFWQAAADHDVLVESGNYPPREDPDKCPIKALLLSKLPEFLVDGQV